MYVGLKQPRGDGERCVTPARAAAKETTQGLALLGPQVNDFKRIYKDRQWGSAAPIHSRKARIFSLELSFSRDLTRVRYNSS